MTSSDAASPDAASSDAASPDAASSDAASSDTEDRTAEAVSYTHLDVYKRQVGTLLTLRLCGASLWAALRYSIRAALILTQTGILISVIL